MRQALLTVVNGRCSKVVWSGWKSSCDILTSYSRTQIVHFRMPLPLAKGRETFYFSDTGDDLSTIKSYLDCHNTQAPLKPISGYNRLTKRSHQSQTLFIDHRYIYGVCGEMKKMHYCAPSVTGGLIGLRFPNLIVTALMYGINKYGIL